VLDLPGSAASLADLARSNLLLVPLDQRGQWYRYHHLFRDVLLAQLERQDPGLIPVLRRRAADWYLRNGMDEDALEHFIAAGDVDSPGASALTAAELRVLPLLASHLPAPEIAAELFVSVHTVKSQQASLYRKLGASSRSQAVSRARQLGLLEG
jgi:ATP/maltotriose-dependent transcriptional regulator MalT